MSTITSKISPCLWFDEQAEEAVEFYTSVFKDSKITDVTHYSVETPSNKAIGSVMTVEFDLLGLHFTALNGGPFFTFNEAISLQVLCDDQAEIDYYWEHLSAVPEAEQCGWLKDKFGLSWQIVPADWPDLYKQGTPAQNERAMRAMLDMKKLDIAALRAAFDQ